MIIRSPFRCALLVLLLLMTASATWAQTDPITPDIPAKFQAPTTSFDYTKREEMIPMRDGVKLHTVIIIPKGAKNAPMILNRTPYNASGRSARSESSSMLVTLPQGVDVFAADGYICVFQDVRGKYGSEGEYVMTRPLKGPLNPTEVDHSTDAYDTIDWLVKNIAESNGKVGMLGSSYEGFTVVMALVHPHPALKVAAPMSPMVDGWMGDDWFHYGAFRQTNLDYFAEQTMAKGRGQAIIRQAYDDYDNFLRAGSAGDFARAARSGPTPLVAQDHRASVIRRVLAGTSARQDHGRTAAKGADDVASRLVGPGGHVGCDPLLPGGRAQRHPQRHEFSRHGAVAAQPGKL